MPVARSLPRKLYALLDKRARRRFLGLVLLSVVSSTLESFGIVLVFALFKVVIDPSIIQQNAKLATLLAWSGTENTATFVALLCAALILIFLAKATIYVLMLYVRQRVEMAVRDRIGTSLLAVYLRSPYEMHLHRNSATLAHNIHAGAAIGSASAIAVADLLSDALLLAGVCATLLWLQPLVTLIALVVFGALGGTYLTMGRSRFVGWGAAANQQAQDMYRVMNEALLGVKQIKTLGVEGYFVRAYAAALRRFGILNLMNSVAQQSLKPIFEFVVMTCLLVPMIVLLLRGVSAASIVPVLGMFAAAALRVLPSLVRSAGIIQNLRFNDAIIDTIGADLHQSPALGEALATRATNTAFPFARELRLDGVAVRYAGAPNAALQGVSLRILRGQSVAIIGPSGAGKTTLVDVMLGLIAPSEGRLLVDDAVLPPDKPNPRLFGYVPQEGFLIDDTVRRNIALGIPDDAIEEERVRRAVGAASLDDCVATLPQGLDTIVGNRGIRLSGGQRQRLAIARALYDDPEILVLDEATSALDPVTEAEVAEALQRLRGRKTLVIIAHRLSTVQKCDCLFLLKAGTLVDSGSFAELSRRNPDFAEMVAKMSVGASFTSAEEQHPGLAASG
ncbi:MAG: putative transporter ATP-binding protein/permease [Rhodospirillales bacterium]|nr:putative transporter ATP-binding protein/permease [Rhodospirillales bacterium]